MSKSTDRHLAITSYLAGTENWDPRWPVSGIAERASTIDRLPDPREITVQDLPARHPHRLFFEARARWVVLEIAAADHVSADGIVEFVRGEVLFNGPVAAALDFLRSQGSPVPSSCSEVLDVRDWGSGSVGDSAIALGGYEAKVSAGVNSLAYARSGEVSAGESAFAISNFGQARAGPHGVALIVSGRRAEAGDFGLARVDYGGEAIAGRGGVALAGEESRARSGDHGVAIGVSGGSAAVGSRGLAVSLDPRELRGAARAGAGGIAIAGRSAQADEDGMLILLFHDGGRLRARVGYVGEDGILPNTLYSLDVQGRFVPAEKP
jgi:hypothetical protein